MTKNNADKTAWVLLLFFFWKTSKICCIIIRVRKFWHLTSAYTCHRIIYIFPGGSTRERRVACHSSCKIVHDTICPSSNHYPLHSSLAHTSLLLYQEPRLLLFLHFGLGEKWRFDNAAGRMDFIIYSVIYVNRRKKYIKEKKPYGRFVLGDGLPFIYFIFIFFYPSAMFSPSERGFLYERIRFLCCTPAPSLCHYYSRTHFLHSPSARTHTHYSIFRCFPWGETLFSPFFSFYCVEVSSFQFMLFVCVVVIAIARWHNSALMRDDDVMHVSWFNRFLGWFFLFLYNTPSCEITK